MDWLSCFIFGIGADSFTFKKSYYNTSNDKKNTSKDKSFLITILGQKHVSLTELYVFELVLLQ